jgi:hypothetical protein
MGQDRESGFDPILGGRRKKKGVYKKRREIPYFPSLLDHSSSF